MVKIKSSGLLTVSIVPSNMPIDSTSRVLQSKSSKQCFHEMPVSVSKQNEKLEITNFSREISNIFEFSWPFCEIFRKFSNLFRSFSKGGIQVQRCCIGSLQLKIYEILLHIKSIKRQNIEQAFSTYNFFNIEICLKQFNVKVIEIDVKILSFLWENNQICR